MNITSINLFSENVKRGSSTNFKLVRPITYITEPIDTVSFGGANTKGAVNISQKVFDFIEKTNYRGAYNILEDVSYSKFNPNYCATLANGEKRSLMGLLLEQFKDMSKLSKKMAEGIFLFSTIVHHPEFWIDNEEDGDLFIKAVNNNLPQPMLDIMYFSNAFSMMPVEEKYPQYAVALEENGYPEMAAEIQADIEAQREEEYYDKKFGCASSESIEPREEISIEKLKVELGPQDPKSLEDVGGYPEMINEIRTYYIKPWHPNNRERYDKHPNIKRPTGLLLSGPPGCGKTYLAHAIAAELGYDFYHLSLSDVGSKWAYDTLKAIPNVFDQLEENYKKTGEPCVLFLDEIDSIASSRENSSSDWKNDDVNALITSINNASQRGIILIGATNLLDNVDSAAHRSGRFDFEYKMGYPNRDGRKDIIEKILKSDEISSGLVKYSEAFADATENFTPADIAAAVGIMWNEILISDDKEFAQPDDFYKALEITKRKIEKNKPKPIGFKTEKTTTAENNNNTSVGNRHLMTKFDVYRGGASHSGPY